MRGQRPLRRLLALVLPVRGGLALATLLNVGTLLSGVGLMATSTYLVARATVVASFVEIQTALVGVRFFAISRGALRYLERYATHDVTFRLLAALRVWFYAAIEPLAPAALWRERGGDLLARIVTDIETLEQFSVRVLVPAVSSLVVAVCASLFLALFDWRLGAILAVSMTVLGVALPLAARRLGRRPAVDLVGARAEVSAVAVDGIQGLHELIAAGRKESQAARLRALQATLDRAEIRLAWMRGLSALCASAAAGLTLVAVLLVAIPLVSEGRLDAVYLAMLALTALAALEAVSPLPAAATELEKSLAAARRLFELTDARPAVVEPESPRPVRRVRGRSGGLPIEVRDLRFSYGPGEPWVLDGATFAAAPGDPVVITGPSGSGKTTLLNLLLRFWDYESGSIRVAGRDVRECAAEDVRDLFGVVAQDTHLFAGSIRTNLLLARPGATDADLAAVARAARINDFIESLPRGYDTWIGENGVLVSGGERQRLAVARALLKDAPILVLDEPAAHLDVNAESELMDALGELALGRTTILAGHHAPGLLDGSTVLELRAGRLLEVSAPIGAL